MFVARQAMHCVVRYECFLLSPPTYRLSPGFSASLRPAAVSSSDSSGGDIAAVTGVISGDLAAVNGDISGDLGAVNGDSSDMSAALGLEDGPVVFSQDEPDGQEEEGEQSVVTDLLTADFLTEDGGRGRNIIIAKGHSNRLGMFLLYLFS